jgi:hypothetical protein
VCELKVPEIRVGGRDGRFGVLRGAVEFNIGDGEIVSDVIPDGGRVAEVDAFLKSIESFWLLTAIEQGAAEADLQFGAFGR